MQPVYTNESIKQCIQNGDVKAVKAWVKTDPKGTNRRIGQYGDHKNLSALAYAAGLARLPSQGYEGREFPLEQKKAQRIVKVLIKNGAKTSSRRIEKQVRSFQFEINANDRSLLVTDELVQKIIKDIEKARK